MYNSLNSYLFSGCDVSLISDYTNEIVNLLNYRDIIYDYFEIEKNNANQILYTNCSLEYLDKSTILDMPVKDYDYLIDYVFRIP